MMEDFNDIAKPSEKFGKQQPSRQKTNIFNSFLNTYSLIDLGFMGPPYTLTNGRGFGQTVITCINRSHATDERLSVFPDTIVIHLPRPKSNHNPIFLKLIP